MKKKQLIIYAASFVALTTLAIVLMTTMKKKKVNSGNTGFHKYITAYTSGVISKTSTIKVELDGKIVDELEKKESIPENLFDFTPNVEGEYKLIGSFIEFKPKENLESGKEYFVDFALDKITKVPDEFEEFTFKFNTIPQNIEIEILEQKTIDKQLKYQQVLGVIRTADVETQENISEILTAKQNNEKLKIKWKSDAEGLNHFFTIDSILRLDVKSEVEYKWDGDAINVDIEGNDKIEIPGRNDFYLINSAIVQQPDQYLQLQFSDPLQENQELEGIITLSGVDNLRFLIEGNTIKIYPQQRLAKLTKVKILTGVKNILGYKLQESENFNIAFEEIKPEVRLVGNGSILPSSEQGLTFPFEAVNLNAVDITIIKIYENNILQFLQNNDFNGDNDLRRVGKPVLRKTIRLDDGKVSNLSIWNRFSLDLNNIMKAEQGAIYRITIGFRKQHSLFSCENSDSEDEQDLSETEIENYNDEAETSNWDNYENNAYQDDYYYYYDNDYWENRENPCHKSYYGKRRNVSRNIIASDLGIIYKQGNDETAKVFVTDLTTAEPLHNVSVELYDYQMQLVKTKITNKNGLADFGKVKNIYFVLAKYEKQKGYLKVQDGSSLSLSKFKIAGTSVKKGLKGFIYGERGVWRPGDTIFTTFILKEGNEKLPDDLPVIFEIHNPQGQIVKREVQTKSKTGFYPFMAVTTKEAGTGNYELKVTIGTVNFSKSLRVETIKPNRLKIDLDFGKKIISEGEKITGNMNVKWLHGASGKDLKVTVDATLKPVKTTFERYSDFTFDDPTKEYYSETERVFDGKTDQTGNTKITASLNTGNEAPGKMKAIFLSKAFEKSGNFSIDKYTTDYSPYTSYVGLKLPKGDKTRGMLLTDISHEVEIVNLTSDGKPVKENQKIDIALFKITWRWWWDEGSNQISAYNYKNSSELLSKSVLTTKNGKAKWNIKIKYPEWGRYLVIARNRITGHSSGKIVYIDWPGWAGRAMKGDSGGASMLSFSSEKKKYKVGEKAKIMIPTSGEGRALINIENGSKVVESHWIETKKGETHFEFEIKKEMTPNIYVNVTLLQKHSQTINDLPVRMYGVIPIMVEDPTTKIKPVLTMPDKLESETTVSIKVSEKNNKPMTYTLAIVDEGLLNLTRFKTPNPWDSFFAKEALGVKTWDLFDDVMGAYSGGLDKLLAIGGDADIDREENGKKANRFTPVVIYLGPFTLKGGSKTHKVKIPRYIGAVRTMVIAGNDNAYGSAEKLTPVVKPLMIIGTLPRILSPSETVNLPISVFAMEKNMKNATVKISTNGLLSVNGKSSKTISFSEPGEENTVFELKTGNRQGVGKVKITATSGGKTSTFEIEIEIRNPNLPATEVLAKVLEPGESWSSACKPVGTAGTNTGTLEVSSIPPISLEQRLKYLIQYPHGCVEQTTSAVFPQLFVQELIDINPTKRKEIEKNVKAGIKKLMNFQLSNGGFAYWQNGNSADAWGTNYAGHFLTEAEKAGYSVSTSVMKKWRKYQLKKAKKYTNTTGSAQLVQAYRLYTLALAGKPAKAAMNSMRSDKKLSVASKWRLAAAYKLSGRTQIAKEILKGVTTNIPAYTELSETYGSDIRDEAMILETLTLLDEKTKAFMVLKKISETLSSNKYLSTQTTAYALLSVSKYEKLIGKNAGLKYSYSFAGESKNTSSSKSISQINLNIDTDSKTLTVKNTSNAVLYVRVILNGTPDVGVFKNSENHLKMSVEYQNLDGKKISPEKISQGSDFIAVVKITNPSTSRDLKQMALTQIFPAGWEIINPRMTSLRYGENTSYSTYQDIRDDRVMTYFDIDKGKTATYRIALNASYIGKYLMPDVQCEAMYNANIYSRKEGKFVEVNSEM